MYDSRSRSRRPAPFAWGGRGERAAWLPLLFIGTMMFWTVAVGLGTWSLMVVSDGAAELEPAGPAPTATEPMPGGVQVAGTGGMPDRIPVQVEESQEPEDVNDNAGSAPPVLPSSGD